jgi:hypothetical protein
LDTKKISSKPAISAPSLAFDNPNRVSKRFQTPSKQYPTMKIGKQQGIPDIQSYETPKTSKLETLTQS